MNMKSMMITAMLAVTAISVYAEDTETAADTAVVIADTAVDTGIITETVPDTAVTIADVTVDTNAVMVVASDTTATVKKLPRGGFVFSLRPEYAIVHGDISSVGAVAEAGRIFENGLYLSVDMNGGDHYFGGGGNVGYLFGKRGVNGAGADCVIGYSLGYYNTDIVVRFESQRGKLLKRFVGSNAGVTGLFVKIMGGGYKNNVDLTGRVMTGYKSGSAWYNEDDGIYTESDFSASYSISLGYTFVRRDAK